jgi:hypothetical protein
MRLTTVKMPNIKRGLNWTLRSVSGSLVFGSDEEEEEAEAEEAVGTAECCLRRREV